MNKSNPNPKQKWTVIKDWAWAYPTYEFVIDNGKKVKSVTIDPLRLMADINLENNSFIVK